MVVLQNWLSVMQRNYHIENPYHNATHAADVLQSAAYFLEKDAVQVKKISVFIFLTVGKNSLSSGYL